MRIGIEVQRLFRKKRYGIETSAIELIHELYNLKTNNEIIVLTKPGDNQKLFDGCSNFNIKYVSGKVFVDFEQFMLPIAASRANIDILHCTGNTTPLLCTKPIVQTLHDIIYMDPIPTTDSLYQRVGNFYRRMIVPIAVKKSKAIITVSHYEKKRIVERLKLNETKVHVIHNGINSQFKKTTNLALLRATQLKYKLPDEFILFLGNSSSRKNPEAVLEAYAVYAQRAQQPLPLVTPGLSNDFIASHLKKKGITQLAGNIHSPGYILQDDLVHIYSLSKLFLFPSLSEGFGMPVLEAMACGVPVITSNLSSLPEISGDAALLINPYHSIEISDAMLEILENPILMETQITKGLKQVQQFQWKHVAEKTMEIYERVYHETAKSTGKPGHYEIQSS